MRYFLVFVVTSVVLASCTTNDKAQVPVADDMTNISENDAVTDSVAADTTATSGSETQPMYTMEEVATHATPEDCWFTIEGKVYDVTGFGDKHGGGEAVYLGCGKDATKMFNNRPNGSGSHSKTARSLLPNFEIGVLAE